MVLRLQGNPLPLYLCIFVSLCLTVSLFPCVSFSLSHCGA